MCRLNWDGEWANVVVDEHVCVGVGVCVMLM